MYIHCVFCLLACNCNRADIGLSLFGAHDFISQRVRMPAKPIDQLRYAYSVFRSNARDVMALGKIITIDTSTWQSHEHVDEC